MGKEKIKQDWINKVQVDKGLKALADIKVLIEKFYKDGFEGDWEILRIIEDIETIYYQETGINKVKNFYLERIKELIKLYYERCGRAEESYSVGSSKPNKMELIKYIEDILNKAKIPSNYLVISRLK